MTHAARNFRPWSTALSFVAAAGLALAPTPGRAAPSKRSRKAAKTTAAEVPATDGKTIAMFRFGGEEAGVELRGKALTAFQEKGYQVKGVALAIGEASAKVKCPADDPEGEACLAKVGEWLNAKPKTAADYLVFGAVAPGSPPRATTIIFDIKGNKVVQRLSSVKAPGDLIFDIVFPQALVAAVEDNIDPPAPATAEELAILAALDEPDKTPEELQAEKDALAKAEADAKRQIQDAPIDVEVTVDLKDDFEALCRTGKREKRASKQDPKDLRPSCKRGPFWGYWQPRTWVTLSLAVAGAATTGLFYGLSLGARGPYKDAVKAVDDYNAAVAPRDPNRDPAAATNGGQDYATLATEVSNTGAIMRRRAIYGDVALGATAALVGVMTIMIFQDRTDAKKSLRDVKELRAISNVRAGPMVTKHLTGAALGFSF